MNRADKTRRLAVELMGYMLLETPCDVRVGSTIYKYNDDDIVVIRGDGSSEWNPYESIADAWQIVERMNGIDIHISRYSDETGNFYVVKTGDGRLGSEWGGRDCKEAICEAALKYLDHKQEDKED